MLSRELSVSHHSPSMGFRTDRSQASVSIFEDHMTSAGSSSFFSDHIHFLSQRTVIPNWLRKFLFMYMCLQVAVISLVPPMKSFWKEMRFVKFVELLGILAFVETPETNSQAYITILGIDIALILFEVVFSLAARFFYNKFRFIPTIVCYISRYTSILMSTIFFPTSAAFLGTAIGLAFQESDDEKAGISLVVLVMTVLTVVRAIGFLTLIQYNVLYSEQIFIVQQASTVPRIYICLFIEVFISHVLGQGDSAVAIPFVVFAFSLGNFFYDLFSATWCDEDGYKRITSMWISAAGISLCIGITELVPTGHDRIEIAFWVSISWVLLCLMIVPVLCEKIVKKALTRLNDPDFVKNSKTISSAVRDIRIGFRLGHENAIECTHIRGLFEKYPNNWNLLFVCARMGLSLSSCPYTVEELEGSLAAEKSFNVIRSHINSALMRIIAPGNTKEVEKYNKQVLALYMKFINLFEDARNLYDVIIDEMPAIFPKVMRSYDRNYDQTVRALLVFVQRYPFSPDGDFFLDLFNILFPATEEAERMINWQQTKPDYVKQNLSFFPRQLPILVKRPDLFRSYEPDYKVRRKDIPTIPSSLKDVAQGRNMTGPHTNMMLRWYNILVVFLAFTFPLVSMALMVAQNDKFVVREEQMAQGWSLCWRFVRSEVFMLPILFFDAKHPFWMGIQSIRNKYYMDYERNLTELRSDLLDFVYGTRRTNSSVDTQLMQKVTAFMDQPIASLDWDMNMSIVQALLTTTFVGGDNAARNDSVLVAPDLTLDQKVIMMKTLSKQVSSLMIIMKKFLREVDEDTSDLTYMSNIAFLVISIVLNLLMFFFTSRGLIAADNKFDVFFKTLRETSKTVVASMRHYIRMCQNALGSGRRRRAKRYKKGMVNWKVIAMIVNLVFCVLMVIFCVLQYSLSNCRIRQVNRFIELYSTYSEGYENLSWTVEKGIMMSFDEGAKDETFRDVSDIFNGYQNAMWRNYDRGTTFCPLCSTVDVYHLYIARGLTYEKIIFNFMAQLYMFISPSFRVDETVVWTQTCQSYYMQVDMTLKNFANKFSDTCASFYERTRSLEILVLVLFTVAFIAFIIFLVFSVHKLDRPFSQIVRLFARFPDNVLAHDTLKILKQNDWSFEASGFAFDSGFYDDILEKSPDGTIIIDNAMNIVNYNIAAQRVININDAIDSNLTKQLIMTLHEVPEDGEEGDDEEPERFESILNEYMSDDRSTILTTRLLGVIDNQKFWFSLTILPIFPETNDLIMSQRQNADRFAIIFRDIGDEKRQQNLVAEETRKHLQIVHQILPTEIATRLLKEQRSISMTVDKVAISFCDIVQFTPWCGSQTPEAVVAALNVMFNLFDERCSKYRTVTKIKCIGDCYMSAAGIFSNGIDPSVFGLEMVMFCLDLIDAIKVVNQKLGTSLRVRIGVALGGPISAGVMGIHKPVFDIWGEAVNDAQNLESGGLPMKVHINQELKDYIDDPSILIEPKGDGTWFCERIVPESEENVVAE